MRLLSFLFLSLVCLFHCTEDSPTVVTDTQMIHDTLEVCKVDSLQMGFCFICSKDRNTIDAYVNGFDCYSRARERRAWFYLWRPMSDTLLMKNPYPLGKERK